MLTSEFILAWWYIFIAAGLSVLSICSICLRSSEITGSGMFPAERMVIISSNLIAHFLLVLLFFILKDSENRARFLINRISITYKVFDFYLYPIR